MRGDLEWGTVPALVQASADLHGAAEVFVDGDRRVSYAELGALVRESAAAAVAAGVEPGDRAAIWAPNSLEWAVAALGLLSAGAALVPVNTRFKGREAGYVLERSRATLLVVANGFLGTDYVGMLRAAYGAGPGRGPVPGLPSLAHVVALSSDVPAGTTSWHDYLRHGTGVAKTTVDERIAGCRPDDPSDVMFTSGTTGHPKGVVVSHAQTLRVFDTWSDVVGLAAGDRYLVVNPFFHTFGYKAGLLACLMRGATVVPQPVFDVPTVLDLVTRERVSVLPGPPTLYQSILDAPDRAGHDLGSLRLAVTGAAVVPVALVERMRAELSFSTVLTAYGLTEATGTVTMCRRGDDPVTVATTSGRAIPDTEVAVVDKDGVALPPGTPGEVVVRGYHVMRGYFEDPEATAAVIDADGWLHTGDVGLLDDHGNLRITDRLKDMYVVGGFNTYPAEVEQVLAVHPDVAEVAVVGVPDDRLGEVGKAYVVPRPGRTPEPGALVAWCRDRLANFKVPRQVELVDALPRNASGKVLKFELRAPREKTTR